MWIVLDRIGGLEPTLPFCWLEVRVYWNLLHSYLQRKKKDKKNLELEVPSAISQTAFYQVLVFIYSGIVQLTTLSFPQAIEVLCVSSYHQELELLEWLCENHIKKELNINTIYPILKAIDRFQNLSNGIKQYCLRWAVENYEQFIGSKEGVREMGIDLFHEVAHVYQLHQAGELKPLANVSAPLNSFVEDFRKLRESVEIADIRFKLLSPNIHGITGTIYPCHKAMLLARAPSLFALTIQTPVQITKGLSAVQIKDITSDAFEAFLHWIYSGETTFSGRAAAELAPFCVDNQIIDLLQICLENMKKDINFTSVLLILHVCQIKNQVPLSFLTTVKELKPQCVQFAEDHLIELDVNIIRERKLHNTIAPDILLAIQKKHKKTIKQQKDSSKNQISSWTSFRSRQMTTSRSNPGLLRNVK